jgi:hypothetical protein
MGTPQIRLKHGRRIVKFRGFAVIPAVAAIAASTILFSATPSDAKAEKIRFRCKAETATLQVDARYQEITTKKNTREQFRAHLEGSGTGLVPGAVVSVLVDTVLVGTITLVEDVPGEVEGQLRFDSKSKGKLGSKSLPFPANFPDLVEGMPVDFQLPDLTELSCELL